MRERLLQAAQRLAASTFRQTEDRIHNANGDGLTIIKREGVYKIIGVSPGLRKVHMYLAQHSQSILIQGAQSKEELFQAIRGMLQELGDRIIE